MADVSKPKPGEEPVEAPKGTAAAPHEADAAGAKAKLEADSKPAGQGTTTGNGSDTTHHDNTTTAAATAANGSDHNHQQGDGHDHPEEEHHELSLYERTIGKVDSWGEIKSYLGFGKQPTPADSAKLPKMNVGDHHVDVAATAHAPREAAKTAAADVAAKPVPTSDATAAPATVPPTKSILGTIGDGLAWTYHAIMPDAAEKVLGDAGNYVCHTVEDWFGGWFDESAKELGVENEQALQSGLNRKDGNYTAEEAQALNTVKEHRDQAVQEGLEGVDKALEAAKKNPNDGIHYESTQGADANSQANRRIAEMSSTPPEQLRNLVERGLEGAPGFKETKDEKTGETIQTDAAGNRRIVGKDGNITFRTADGLTVNRAKDGKETYLKNDTLIQLQRNENGEVTAFQRANSRDRTFITQIGNAQQLISLDPFKIETQTANPEALVTARDRVATFDDKNKLSVGFDRENHQLVVTGQDGQEWRIQRNPDGSRTFFHKDKGGELKEIKETDMPAWLKKGAHGQLMIGDTEIRDLRQIFHRLRSGQTHQIEVGADGQISTTAQDTTKPDQPKLEGRTTPDGGVDVPGFDGKPRHITPDGKIIGPPDANGKPEVIDIGRPDGQLVAHTRDLDQNEHGVVTINSSGTTIDRNGVVTSADGRTLVNSDGSWGSGLVSSDVGPNGLSRAEAAKIESQAASTSAKVASIGSMALSIAHSGNPNALGIMRHLAWAGIGLADAGMAQAQGYAPAIITLSLSKSYAVSALNVTNDQSRALAEVTRLGIFDGSTVKEAMIAGSFGSTYITPESAALHFAQGRRPELKAVA